MHFDVVEDTCIDGWYIYVHSTVHESQSSTRDIPKIHVFSFMFSYRQKIPGRVLGFGLALVLYEQMNLNACVQPLHVLMVKPRF